MVVSPPKVSGLELALASAEHACEYINCKHAIEILGKDEENRVLRTGMLLLELDVGELQDQLQQEQEIAERSRTLVEDHLAESQERDVALRGMEQKLHTQHCEMGRLQAELDTLRNTTQDIDTVLVEKLTLARELSTLRPEVQHLRAQAASIEQLVGAKIDLQRQLAEAQCEVESARAETKRAQAKRRNTTMEIAQETQLEDLKKQLAREKRARAHAEQIAEQAQSEMNVDDIRRQLAKEKKLREKLEEELEASKENTQLEDVRRDLLKAKRAKQKLEDQNESLQGQIEREQQATARAARPVDGDSQDAAILKEVRDELALERAARAKDEKSNAKKEEQWDAEKATMEEKLNQFRVKLRETKELLAATKDALAAATERASVAEHAAQMAAMVEAVTRTPVVKKVPNKRPAKVLEPGADETALGTPGDGPVAKRSRTAKAAIGSKSSFSITPFLNKTAVIDDNDQAQLSDAESPIKTPLAPAASIRRNSKLGKPVPAESGSDLLPVDEEAVTVSPKKSAHLNAQPENAMQKPKDKPVATKQKTKPRKSLVNFETFQQCENEPVVKQKKRKLGGRGPTLFDEDDAAELPGSKSGFAGRALLRSTPGNRMASLKKSNLTANSSRSGLVSANDGSGFQFSPLRRNRKNLDDTLRG